LGHLRKFLSRSQGATAVEFAVVFPLFLAMLLFTVTFSKVAYVQSHLNKVVGEAARYARLSSAPSPTAIETFIVNRMAVVSAVVPDVEVSAKQDVGTGVKRTLTASITLPLSIPLYSGLSTTVTAAADLFTRD
jgi:Flp pilus assembly protein TadG